MEAVENSNSLEQKITGMLEKFPVILQLCRFAAIGVMNTALDFLILNYISKSFGITSGLKLGELNIIGFILALIQSYFWNRYWAFNTQAVSLLKNFIRLVLVGLLGGLTMVLVLVSAKLSATGNIYLLLLVIYIIFQLILWAQFKLSVSMGNGNHSQFIAFFIITSII
jgi:putative flippase GtrA